MFGNKLTKERERESLGEVGNLERRSVELNEKQKLFSHATKANTECYNIIFNKIYKRDENAKTIIYTKFPYSRLLRTWFVEPAGIQSGRIDG